MPDGLGELASHLNPGHLGAALAAEATLGALVVLGVDRVLGGVDRRFDERPTQVPRQSFSPDWMTRGHNPV